MERTKRIMNYVVGFISDNGLLGRTWETDSMDQVKQVLRYIAKENQDDELTEELIEQFDHACNHATRFGIYFVGGLETWEA
jgi:hypothetical protein